MKKTKFFNFQYSWILVPLIFLLFIFVDKLRIYLTPLLYTIALVGWIVNFMEPKKWWEYILAFIGHLPCLIFLFWGFNYFKLNLIIWLISIFGMLFIWYMPFWPYLVSREFFYKIYLFVIMSYFILCLIFQNFNY